ncbi:hypothetical protein XELAEV_18005425mg [Xenopus laevis]|uniref:Uncharacterized protein n=1 Tax=Xenopus laevis TaxID=8355 RepID=A0A974DZB5_XENLA|nr:hypothetical protein XELAEV_18005425mg [Xenopus laevis]
MDNRRACTCVTYRRPNTAEHDPEEQRQMSPNRKCHCSSTSKCYKKNYSPIRTESQDRFSTFHSVFLCIPVLEHFIGRVMTSAKVIECHAADKCTIGTQFITAVFKRENSSFYGSAGNSGNMSGQDKEACRGSGL